MAVVLLKLSFILNVGLLVLWGFERVKCHLLQKDFEERLKSFSER